VPTASQFVDNGNHYSNEKREQQSACFRIVQREIGLPIFRTYSLNNTIRLKVTRRNPMKKTHRIRKITKTKLLCEKLEERRLLAIDVAVIDGDLVISGEANGAVTVRSLEDGSIEVQEGDKVVANFTDVTDDILIDLDSTGTIDDTVIIDLDAKSVDRLMVDLGNGDNQLLIESGKLSGSLLYRGGDGNDLVLLSEDSIIDQNVFAFLGDGDDQVTLDGTVNRSVIVRGGDGDDTVEFGETSEVGRVANLDLGMGNNNAVIAGQIEKGLKYRGGDDNDSIQIKESASIYSNVSLNLGDGDNLVSHKGDIDGNLVVKSMNSKDTVVVDESAIVSGRTIQRLGRDSRMSFRIVRHFHF
jgi:hypothetical protein